MVEDQRLVLSAWALVSATLLGLGLLERRVSGSRTGSASDLWLSFWMGWGLLLSILQVLHLFLPVDDKARWMLVALGGAGWLLAGAAPWRIAGRILRTYPIGVACVALCAWWLSNRSLAGPTFGDTGLYLVPAVLWVESFAIVPGLANLYVPLGHNVSYFLYAAFLDAGPFAGRFYHLVNSTLVLALFARGLLGCFRLLRGHAHGTPGDMFYALALVPVTELTMTLYFGSPMPDTAVFLFGLVLAGELVELAAAASPSRARLLRLVFLSAVGITVKLSLAAMALTIALVASLIWLWRVPATTGARAGALLLAALVGLVPTGVWLVRSAVMSGLPFYPAQVLPLPVDWIARVDATEWVQKPMAMAPLLSIFSDPAWWRTRLESLGWFEPDVIRPLVVAGIGAAAFVVAKPLQWWRAQASAVPLIVLVVPVASFFFSFVNTPMPRYQGATLWILAIDLFVIGFALASDTQGTGRLRRAALVLFAVAGAGLAIGRSPSPWLPLKEFEITSRPVVHDHRLASGLVVGMPENQVCWWAPLPCTPEPHPGLELRDLADLGAGFRIPPHFDPSPVDPSQVAPSQAEPPQVDPSQAAGADPSPPDPPQ